MTTVALCAPRHNRTRSRRWPAPWITSKARGWTALRYATTKQYFKDSMHPQLAAVLRQHGGVE